MQGMQYLFYSGTLIMSLWICVHLYITYSVNYLKFSS